MINTAILALLIYLAVAVKELQEKVFPDPNVMIPMSHKMTDQAFEDVIKNFLIQKIQEIEQYGNQFSDINCDAFGYTCFIHLYVEGTKRMPKDY